MARPTSRGVLSFGLVSIPVELYSAIEDHNIRFHLLHKSAARACAMAKTGRVALAQTVFHNKESLVLIRSVKRGLVLHFVFFKNEIRDFDAIVKGEDIKLPGEQELGMSLIEKMSSADFEPERYADEYRERALALIEKKVEGQEIKAVAPAPRRSGQVVDIFVALKKSLETAGSRKLPPIEASAKGRHRLDGIQVN